MTEHTPGPWKAEGADILGPSGDGSMIHCYEPNAEANARLGAAAPDLLAALERAQRLFDEALPKFNWGASALDANAIQLLNEVPGEVRAAIAKTKGE